MTAPLRIAQVCADAGVAPGSTKGAAQHLRGIAAGLILAGHSLTTFAERPAEGDYPASIKPLRALDDHDFSRVDVIYERYSLGHARGLQLAEATNTPFVLEVNSPLVAEATAHRPHTLEPHHHDIEVELLARADLVITVSTSLTAWAQARRTGPTVTIPNGYEPRWFRRQESQPRFPLVFLGHPKPWHGADRVPPLLQTLAARGHRSDLLVIGGGAGADHLLGVAESLAVRDQIHVTGALPPEQATALLAQARIGLAPYPAQDPFYFCPLKIVDYMAAGLAIVATDQGDIASMLGDTGVVVAPDDDAALVDAVESLLVSPASCAELGEKGRRRAAGRMTWSHVAARTEQEIYDLLGAGAAAGVGVH